jgi:hypothetical protein
MLPVPVPRVPIGELSAVARDLATRTGRTPAPELEAAEFRVPYDEPEIAPEDDAPPTDPGGPALAGRVEKARAIAEAVCSDRSTSGPFRVPCECGGKDGCEHCQGTGVDHFSTFEIHAKFGDGCWHYLCSISGRSAVDAVRRAHAKYPDLPTDCLRPASLWSVQAHAAIDVTAA